jgi:fructokinase
VLARLMAGFGFDTEQRRGKVFFDTDVNVPAMFEFVQAQASQNDSERVKESLCYVTVGTGIGIGLIINGKCVHGLMHPEGGHVRVPISPLEESKYGGFRGVCPFHGNCIEGLCSNVAIKERLGLADVHALADLSDDDAVWDLIGEYLGNFCANLFLTVSVEKIIIGGGVCSRAVVMDTIRAQFIDKINNYVQMP